MSAPAPVLTHHADSNAEPGWADRAHERAEALLSALQESSDAERRAKLPSEAVLLTLDLAEGVARRFRGRGMELEDLVQLGRIALVKAAQGYRCRRGRSFAAYAVPMIAGEVKRHFRDNAWAVRPPRRLQELRAELAHGTSNCAGCPAIPPR
jgi:RNA polymerase sigma-B factor